MYFCEAHALLAHDVFETLTLFGSRRRGGGRAAARLVERQEHRPMAERGVPGAEPGGRRLGADRMRWVTGTRVSGRTV
jgi:hypothetical protein